MTSRTEIPSSLEVTTSRATHSRTAVGQPSAATRVRVANQPRAATSAPRGRPGLDPTALLEAGEGVIWIPDWPQHARAIARLARNGKLVRLMRGLYVAPGGENSIPTLIRAVQTAYPNAIFTGATAAWLHGWSDVKVDQVTAVHGGRSLRFGKVRLVRGRLADCAWTELNGLRLLTPAMTAVDVAPRVGAELIDSLMRRARDPRGTLTHLQQALAASPGRVGNRVRSRLLARTTTRPFSEAERQVQDLLDAAGIIGWVANEPHWIRGSRVLPDLTFKAERLIVEIDGYAFHSSRDQFRNDRRRQNQLVLEGWRVLRFTWEDITATPKALISEIQEALLV